MRNLSLILLITFEFALLSNGIYTQANFKKIILPLKRFSEICLFFFCYNPDSIQIPNTGNHVNDAYHHARNIQVVHARNLPESNGASGVNRGTMKSLLPIINLKSNIESAFQSSSQLSECKKYLDTIPSKEKVHLSFANKLEMLFFYPSP
jgi:hypothetical protein